MRTQREKEIQCVCVRERDTKFERKIWSERECVCVCKREREREKDTELEREKS